MDIAGVGGSGGGIAGVELLLLGKPRAEVRVGVGAVTVAVPKGGNRGVVVLGTTTG
jgi:hypothetical protein